ncbi:MAG: BMP family ABC transporter substrate-binding protein [Solobacterium sp.]|nr:BMP family ABC transporter substrate-binding protein [Solobacterium sp.]
MIDEYLKAKKSGEKAFHQAVLRGKYPYISCLEDILEGKTITEKKIGTFDIPLAMVQGTRTRGRANAFAPNYMPLQDRDSEFAYKWINVYNAQTSRGIDDPIKVYEYRHRFYVQEGNKRVSVFRWLGMRTAAAEVYRVSDGEEDPLYEEFLEFYRNVPLYELDFSETGRYRSFIRLLGRQPDEAWKAEDVQRLKSTYYLFEQQFMKCFPDSEDSISDAFFLYISVYGYEQLHSKGSSVISDNLKKLKKEIEVKESSESVVLVEDPDEKKSSSLLDILPVFNSQRALFVSFIYDSDAESSASVFEHEIGRILLEHTPELQIHTAKYEFCDTEDKLEQALDHAAITSDIVFTILPTQMNAALKAAVKHPDTIFMNCSLNLKVNAVRSYAVRTYEAKFLLGALAAVFSDTHRIAYIADYPIYGTIADINAFAIGASMIDPDVRVYLCWSEALDSEQMNYLKEQDISVFSGPDSLHQENNTTKYGIYRIGEDGSVINLAEPVINWAVFYRKLIGMIRSGSWNTRETDNKSVNYWWGMSADVLDVKISGSLPYATRKLILLLKQALIKEALNPFSGELHSQTGIVQDKYSGILSNEEIITMDWLNDNIIGSIPTFSSLNETARQMADVSGVRKVRETK